MNSNMTTHITTCPICGTEVKTEVESAPDWYHNDSGILLRIYCNEIRRDYLIAATLDKNGKVWVEESTQTLLNLLRELCECFVSRRKSRAIDFQECWWGYYIVEIVGLLESQESFVANHQAAFLQGYQRIRQLPSGFEYLWNGSRK